MTLPTIQRFADYASLMSGTADLVAAKLAEAISQRGRGSVALSGGKTPRVLHQELAMRPLDWSRIHIYFGDERCVPADDPASNYRMARETLLDHVPIPPAHVHRIAGELAPTAAATSYAEQLATALPLDVVILGMGDDGHTASIFPGEPEPSPHLLAIATKGPVAPHDRVSMTLHAIRACHSVIMVVTGKSKAARLAQVYAELAAERPTLPAAAVGPAIWMIDEDAASEIPR